ncbi:MAG: hypothetical protein IH905_01605 [Proteobacteria bacterium]|nr:hypothetical protein [Pseudomonadota bacterium]
MLTSLLRHAAMVCHNARHGLPERFADGTSVAMPDAETRAAFARRAARYTTVANRLERRTLPPADNERVRVPRRLPAAVPTTGTLTALEVHPRFGRNPNSQALAEPRSGAPAPRLRSFGVAR